MKSNTDNNMIERIGPIYTETKTELSRIIWSGMVCDENQKEQ